MERLSALLGLWEGGKMLSFGIFFVVSLNMLLCKRRIAGDLSRRNAHVYTMTHNILQIYCMKIVVLWFVKFHKNIARHTAYTIVHWPNPDPSLFEEDDKIEFTYSHNHHERNGQAEVASPIYIG